jgi:hypothetical protein
MSGCCRTLACSSSPALTLPVTPWPGRCEPSSRAPLHFRGSSALLRHVSLLTLPLTLYFTSRGHKRCGFARKDGLRCCISAFLEKPRASWQASATSRKHYTIAQVVTDMMQCTSRSYSPVCRLKVCLTDCQKVCLPPPQIFGLAAP